jgi:apolipoprotein D and lipocalin family protein
MNRARTQVAAVVFGVVASLAAPGCGSAAPLDVAPDVNLSLLQGKWYEIARLPRSTQASCNGTTAFYTLQSDGSLSLVNQCNLGASTGPLYTVSMRATVPSAAVPAKLTLQVGAFSGDYWILEVGPSYDYAVVGHPSRDYWWLLSRTPSLDSATTEGALGRAKNEGFDVSQIEYTPQPPAGERNTMTTPEGPIPASPTMGCAVTRPSPGGNDLGAWSLLGLLVAAVPIRRRADLRRH